MWRAVGAEEKAWIARGGCFQHGAAVAFGLEHGQAVIMGPQPALKQGIAVIEQVLRGNGCRQSVGMAVHEVDRLGGGDVFEYDFEPGQAFQQRTQNRVDVTRLPVEDIHAGIGHLAMDQQRQPDFSQRLKRREDPVDMSDAGFAMGRGACWIELDPVDEAGLPGQAQLLWRGGIRQVQRHQGNEVAARGTSAQNPVTIGGGMRDGGDGRPQVGHYNRPAKHRRRRREHGRQHRAIAQVQMPVIRAGQGQFTHGRGQSQPWGERYIMDPLMVWVVLAAIALVGIIYVIVIYNNLVRLKHNVSKAWSNIDVLLRQRHDELPKLVETCRRYMQHERETLERVISARTAVGQAREKKDMAALSGAESLLRTGLGQLFAVAEQYPELRADASFQHLRERITGLENAIADRREFYNDSVNRNNIRIETFPDVILARFFRFESADLLEFDAEDTADVSLGSLFES